jgi:hypothetical protein
MQHRVVAGLDPTCYLGTVDIASAIYICQYVAKPEGYVGDTPEYRAVNYCCVVTCEGLSKQ